MSVAIKVKNVSKSFNDSVILDDISIDFYENKITDLWQKREKYSAYLLDAKNGNYDFSTESVFVGIQDEDVKKEIVSALKNNYKKRKKGEKVERIEKIMNRS